MSLSQELISLIRNKRISDADLKYASLFVLDALANAAAGRTTEPGKKLQQWARAQGTDSGRQAFVVGGLTHILETDDLHRASVTHPGCVVVPAVLAFAAGAKSTGVDFLQAILHGYEAMCRIGNAVGPTHYQVWHNTATCGPYGSAMAVATLSELSDEQAMHALGNAGTQSSGFWEFLETGAMSKHLHAGRAAESGLVAAQLAGLDFTGPPAVLEGKRGFFAAACPDANPEIVIADANAPWQLRQTSIKPWPCCRHTHPAIDAALALHEELAGASIESVQVDTYQAALDVCNRPTPDSEYEAKFSLYHTVAAALEYGKVDFNSFDSKARTDLADMRTRVTVNAAEPWNSNYPVSWGARVSVSTASGSRHSSERHGARGDPEHALDEQEMIEKARMLLKLADMDDSVADQFIDGILQLANGDDAERAIGFLNAQFR